MGRRGAPDTRGVEAAANQRSRNQHAAYREADRRSPAEGRARRQSLRRRRRRLRHRIHRTGLTPEGRGCDSQSWRSTTWFFRRAPRLDAPRGAEAEGGQGLAMLNTSAGRFHPVWASLVSALLSVLAFLAAMYAAGAIAGDRVLLFELIFRPLV